MDTPISRWLERAPPGVFGVYATAAAFCTYFCMYAFRKPFAAATYEGTVGVAGIEMETKIAFVISQVFGYAISKFLGIKVVSEMPPARRAFAIAGAIAVAELALLLFAVIPSPYNAFALFLNGLPLGMVWGLVFGFLEGRRTSDALGAGLCASFIVASGAVKTVGKWVLGWGVTEVWMPVTTGALFFLPMLGFVWLLAQVPPPTADDEADRTHRQPMDASARREFFGRFAPGLILLIVAYVLISAYRDFRDNFARELWDALGYEDAPSIMTTAELPVAFGALLAVGLVMLSRSSRRALWVVHGLLALGSVLILGSTVLFQAGALGAAPWMIAVGLGIYVGYVPYNCVLFDRFIPAVGYVGTAGFLIYVSDSFGYAGSVALLLYKNFGHPDLSWREFFEGLSYASGLLSLAMYAGSVLYFRRKIPPAATSTRASTAAP